MDFPLFYPYSLILFLTCGQFKIHFQDDCLEVGILCMVLREDTKLQQRPHLFIYLFFHMINVLSLLCFDLALLRAQFLHPAFCLSMELIWISYLDVSSKWICILKMSLFSSSKIALFCVPLSVGAPPLGKATASGFTTAPYCTPLLQPFHHQLLSPAS